MDQEWNKLLVKAKELLNSKNVSSFMNCGNYSCTILTDKGNIYGGVNIESNLQGTSAEKAAICNMVSSGEFCIKKMLVLNELEEIVLPIDDTIFYLLEMGIDLDSVVIFNKGQEMEISELLPDWWGTIRIAN